MKVDILVPARKSHSEKDWSLFLLICLILQILAVDPTEAKKFKNKKYNSPKQFSKYHSQLLFKH